MDNATPEYPRPASSHTPRWAFTGNDSNGAQSSRNGYTDPDLKQRHDLLITIPSIAEASIPHLLTALSEHHGFTSAKQVVAFAGLAPAVRQSKTHLAKNREHTLRKVLYMPALVAWQHHPPIRTFCERLKANGKNGKAVVCAAMRKLIHLAFAILKSGRPFNPNYAV